MKPQNFIGLFLMNISHNLHIIIIFPVFIVFISFTGTAQQYTLTNDDVVVEDGIIQSCSYNFDFKNIIIPEILDGQAVLGIADKIGNQGVFVSKNITSVQFPGTIEYIGDYAFFWNDITSIDISNCSQLYRIGDFAFGINSLYELNLTGSTSLTLIGERAFFDNNIHSLDLSFCSNLTSINEGAFEANEIPSLNLSSCSALEKLGNRSFYSNPISMLDISNCSNLRSIGQNCFAYGQLTALDLSPCPFLKNIGKQAFISNNITSLNLINNSELTNIGKRAFSGNNISSIDLGYNTQLKCIGAGAFTGNNLNSLVLPICSGYETYGWIDGNGIVFSGGERINNFSPYYIVDFYYTYTSEDLVIEDGIISECYYDHSFKSVSIAQSIDGQTITGIGGTTWNEKGIFEGNELLRLQLPETIENIGEKAFMLNELTYLHLSVCPNIETIGISSFQQNNIQLLDLTNCSNITVIDDAAFLLNKLQNVDLSPCPLIERIGAEAFSFNEVLKTVNLSGCSKLEIIDDEAFSTNDIQQIDLSDCISLKNIGWHAFLWNGFLTDVNLNGCTSLITIEQWAFSGTSVSNVDLSSCTSLVNLGYGAFDETQVSNIILPTPDYPGFEFWEGTDGIFYNAGDTVSKVEGYYAKDVRTPVTFVVTNDGSPVDSATIDFYNGPYFTNEQGMLELSNVLQGSYPYTVSAEGFVDVEGEVLVDIDSVSVSIEMSGVMVEEFHESALRVYPNPGNHQLYISLPADFIDGRVELFSNSGQLLFGQNIVDNRSSLYTGNLPSGIYLYRIYSGQAIIGSGKWGKE